MIHTDQPGNDLNCSAYTLLEGKDVGIAHESMVKNRFVSFDGVLEGYSGNRRISSVNGFRMIERQYDIAPRPRCFL